MGRALRRFLGLEELDLMGGVRIVGVIGKTLREDMSEASSEQEGLQADDVLVSKIKVQIMCE